MPVYRAINRCEEATTEWRDTMWLYELQDDPPPRMAGAREGVAALDFDGRAFLTAPARFRLLMPIAYVLPPEPGCTPRWKHPLGQRPLPPGVVRRAIARLRQEKAPARLV